ncbi:MAG: hypothetical protein ACRD1O_00265 [Terriglobia bacterium]
MIDQTRLPSEEVYVTCRTCREVADAIRNMVISGARPGSKRLLLRCPPALHGHNCKG